MILKVLGSIKEKSKKVTKNIIYYKDQNLAPLNKRSDDVYLVSYPKSGSTWLSFLLANTNFLMANESREATFFNIHQYIPDIHSSRNIPPPTLRFPGFRFIKSHSEKNNFYNNVIYLVRNPEDVLISYYRFLTGLNTWQENFPKFIYSKYGIKSWFKHVKGWCESSDASQSFMLLKYEDLKKDTCGELSKIYSMLGLQVPKDTINKAIEMSSVKEMKQAEIFYNYGGRPISKDFKMVNQDKNNFLKSSFSGNKWKAETKNLKNLLEKFNYQF